MIPLLIIILLQNLQFDNPWIRSASKNMTTAAFVEIINNSDVNDTLYKAESKIAKVTQIHETYMKDDMMAMREIKELVIPAKSKVVLKPRSFHIMLIGLKKNLEVDKQEEITLFFKNKGEVNVKFKIKKMGM